MSVKAKWMLILCNCEYVLKLNVSSYGMICKHTIGDEKAI